MKARNWTLFHLGHAWHLAIVPVCDDDDYSLHTGWWLSGRLAGRLVHYFWRFRTPRPFSDVRPVTSQEPGGHHQ